jgi:hypothetical protein
MRRIICVAGVIGCVALSVPRSAHTAPVENFLATVEQVGPNVVVTGSGAIDLSGLTFNSTGHTAATGVFAAGGLLAIGPAAGADVDVYTGFTGPSSFGSGGLTLSDAGSGGEVSIWANAGDLYVPAGYTSGSPLSDTMTFDDTTLAGLGLTPGTYTYSWGATDPTFTIEIGATPLPAALPLFASGLGALGLLGWRRKRKAQAAA